MPDSQFIVKNTDIPGLLEITLTTLEDERGWFQEKFQKEKLIQAGLPADFQPVQQNISFNKEIGVTRGIHAEPWDKYISLVSGKIFAVFVDLRKENFGKIVSIEITPEKAVFIPRGVANSFQTLVPDTYYTYLVNDHWSAENQTGYMFVNLADPDLKISWPIPLDKSIISQKDKNHPFLKDIQERL